MNKLIIRLVVFVIIICFLFVPTMSADIELKPIEKGEKIFYGNLNFAWPIPGYTTISSPFGKRTAPTSGASTFHKGTDIPAPEGTALVATCDGEITFIGFLGGGGYTITITTVDGIKISYCHVSPNYIVIVGQKVEQGEIIGNVGITNNGTLNFYDGIVKGKTTAISGKINEIEKNLIFFEKTY